MTDDDIQYRTLIARDARFDGVFFVGVKSTGIYCRPVCTAKTPGGDRCRFFASAALAEQAGFRPCLRCRPELAPRTCYSEFDCPVGRILVVGDGQFVTGLFMPHLKGWKGPDSSWKRSEASFGAVRQQLDEYFAGERQQFELPLKLAGTPFQQRIWQELLRIPFGTTITYLQLARRVGKPLASRAVGNANSRNPISIIVPCHRVIGANGKLTGYAGGIDKKEWLLAWERSLWQ